MTLIGKTIRNYEIIEEIGRGGMGTVYKARQPSLNRSVAIKILAVNLGQDVEFIKRFQQEALATAALEHPNIIHIYDAGEEKGLYFIAMEYIPGGNLFARMRANNNKPMLPSEAVGIMSQIAAGLDFAHRRGFVHRDVKPSNILIDQENNRAVLSDLGIAHALEGTRLTRTGSIMGTPEYMSPEQAEGKELDGRADLYSLGIVLYEMLTGRVPFQADTPLVMLYKHIHENPVDPRKRNSTIPSKLSAALLRSLAKDPVRRFATGQEMAAALLASVPNSAMRFSQSAETVVQIRHTPKSVALSTWKSAQNLGAQSLRAFGRFSLHLLKSTVQALIEIAVFLIVLAAASLIILSFVLAQYLQTTLRDSRWEFGQLSTTRPYQVTSASFALYTAPNLEQRSFGALTATSLSFTPPDRLNLSGKLFGNNIVLGATISAADGAPQLQLQHLNNIPLPIIGGIISNGINQGIRESWQNAPVRVLRVSVSDNTLSVETTNR